MNLKFDPDRIPGLWGLHQFLQERAYGGQPDRESDGTNGIPGQGEAPSSLTPSRGPGTLTFDGEAILGLVGLAIMGAVFYLIWLFFSGVAWVLQQFGVPVTGGMISLWVLISFITFSTIVCAEMVALFLLPPRWRFPWIPLWAIGVASLVISYLIVSNAVTAEIAASVLA